MYKETIKYTNHDGEEVEDTFYFNLTAAEATEFNLKVINGKQLDNYVRAIAEAKNYGELVTIFKELILTAYGEKINGKFIKRVSTPFGEVRLADAFATTEAYSILFEELATDSDHAAAFVNGIGKNIKKRPEQMTLASAT